MRYALTVNVTAWPPDIARLWREALRPHGMVAELAARFQPEAHAGGPLTFRLAIATDVFGGAGEFGDPPLRAGFDASFERLDPVDHDRLTAECPARVRGVYRRSPCEAHFVTDERHTAIDIRLQCFAAAALAVAGDGVMHDSTPGDYVLGAEAFRHDALQADRHEARVCLPVARYDRAMIKNPQAYARQSEEEDRAALQDMTAEESIAVGEALLTSDLMRLAQFPDDDHPCSLAIALGLRSTADGRRGRDRLRLALRGGFADPTCRRDGRGPPSRRAAGHRVSGAHPAADLRTRGGHGPLEPPPASALRASFPG
jgi:hypothetical protein